MRKRGRKNNTDQPQHDSGDRSDGLVLTKQIEVKQELKAKADDDSAQGTRDKIPSRGALKRLKEFLRTEPTVTDYIVAFFTAVLAVTAIIQVNAMFVQSDTMKKDQRPWIQVTCALRPPTSNTPLQTNFHAVNSGKTPAKNVHVDMVIKFVKNGEHPTFDYPENHPILDGGVMFPNSPTDQVVNMLDPRSNDRTTFYLPTDSELQDFSEGKNFIVTYGRVTYSDYFKVQHWTQFCLWHVGGKAGAYTAAECTKYSDIDEN